MAINSIDSWHRSLKRNKYSTSIFIDFFTKEERFIGNYIFKTIDLLCNNDPERNYKHDNCLVIKLNGNFISKDIFWDDAKTDRWKIE